MRFVIVKEGSNVIGKEVLAGDDEVNAQLIDERRLKNKEMAYEEVDEAAFDKAVIVPPPSKEQTHWQAAKAKGTDKAIEFLAKQLGLE